MARAPRPLSENWRQEWLEEGRERDTWRDVVREIGRFAWLFRFYLAGALVFSGVIALIAWLG